MKPPSDRLLDSSGAGTDLPAPARPRYGLRWPVVLLAATVLAVLSSALALSFTRALGKPTDNWVSLVALNTVYWYVWALFTPTIVWLSQHFRFERQGLVRAILIHVPSVALFSFAHIAAMAGAQWWLSATRADPWWGEVKRSALLNFDWEMMTYWAIAGLSHAVLYYRESRDRALRASQLETELVGARMAALQHQLQPHFLFNTLHAISALMHRDVDAADRTLMRLSDLLRMTLENLGQHESTLKAELDFLAKYLEIEQTRFADRLVVRFDVQPETLDALLPTFRRSPGRDISTSARDRNTTSSGSKSATMAADSLRRRSPRFKRESGCRPLARACSISSAPTSGSSSIASNRASPSLWPFPGAPSGPRIARKRTTFPPWELHDLKRRRCAGPTWDRRYEKNQNTDRGR
jgi:two-component system LytT family sensor kinase